MTGILGVTAPTDITTYPNPYQPSYDTIGQLFKDSTFVVLATVQPLESSLGGYPISVQESLVGSGPRTNIGITTQEFTAAKLSVGSTYVFFYAIDTSDNAACIVGGPRGVFSYSPSPQAITRIGASPTSQIAATQSLAQMQSQLAAAQSALSGAITNPPPACEPSATGLAAS